MLLVTRPHLICFTSIPTFLLFYSTTHTSLVSIREGTSKQIWRGQRLVKKSLICLEGEQMNHHLEKHFCLLFHQEATSPSYRTLDKPNALHPELQKYKDTVWCGVLGAEVPGDQQEQLSQSFFVRLLNSTSFQNSLRWAPSLSPPWFPWQLFVLLPTF